MNKGLLIASFFLVASGTLLAACVAIDVPAAVEIVFGGDEWKSGDEVTDRFLAARARFTLIFVAFLGAGIVLGALGFSTAWPRRQP